MTGHSTDSRLDETLDAFAPQILALAQKICGIPAPTFHESERARFVLEEFAAQGREPWIDDIGNVYVRLPAEGKGTAMLAAHLDTVFPLGTDLTVRREEDRLIGPGIGDNSLSVATLLTLPRLLSEAGVQLRTNLLLCGDVGEEGLGNLRGIRRAVEDHPEVDTVIALEGHGLGHITNTAVGSRRVRITVHGPGGHSWGAFGKPSAIHVLGQIISAIAQIAVPATPKTTYNVGMIEGGVSINTIAPAASMLLDMRSVSPDELASLEAEVNAIVAGAIRADAEISVQIELLGNRPAGETPPSDPLVQQALRVLSQLGLEPELRAGSTDANIPIAAGISSICYGLTTGGNTHSTVEFINMPPLTVGLKGLAQLLQSLPAAS